MKKIMKVFLSMMLAFGLFFLPAASTNASSTVYYTRTGTKYHSTKNCVSLKRSKVIYSTSLANAKKKKLGACKLCCRGGSSGTSSSTAKKTGKLSTTTETLYVGESFTLTLTGVSSSGTIKVSKKGIVTYKKLKKNKWKITAKKAGTVKVTVTAAKKKYVCKVTVKKA